MGREHGDVFLQIIIIIIIIMEINMCSHSEMILYVYSYFISYSFRTLPAACFFSLALYVSLRLMNIEAFVKYVLNDVIIFN